MENYIVINGKKAELTKEQLKALGISAKLSQEIFQQVAINSPYYFITASGSVGKDIDVRACVDAEKFEAANYCSDKNIIQQQAYREILNRLLWRFSMQNGGDDLGRDKYYIAADNFPGRWNVYVHSEVRAIGLVYFKTHDLADQAIHDIVKPFMKAHPDFKP